MAGAGENGHWTINRAGLSAQNALSKRAPSTTRTSLHGLEQGVHEDRSRRFEVVFSDGLIATVVKARCTTHNGICLRMLAAGLQRDRSGSAYQHRLAEC